MNAVYEMPALSMCIASMLHSLFSSQEVEFYIITIGEIKNDT